MQILTSNAKIVQHGHPMSVVDTVLTVGANIDTKGFKRATFLIMAGACTTAKLVDAYINEGATTSPATKVTGSDITQLVGASSVLNVVAAIEVNLMKRKRYLKAIITVSGTSATALLACLVILQGGKQRPLSLTESGCAERVAV